MDLLVPIDVECPYCGEVYSIYADTSQGAHEMVEDCTVCCRPILVEIECEPGEVTTLNFSPG